MMIKVMKNITTPLLIDRDRYQYFVTKDMDRYVCFILAYDAESIFATLINIIFV